MQTPRPRYDPESALPPYTYVPGRTPHPVTDPRGHMFGETPGTEQHADTEDWWSSPTYRRGIDLFNHGYYWEAHEAWERLWIAAGRGGVAGDFLKGLIKLAAAGVKVREGNRAGAQRHLARASQLFQQTIGNRSKDDSFGLDLQQLLNWAGEPLPDVDSVHDDSVTPVFGFVLVLQTPEP